MNMNTDKTVEIVITPISKDKKNKACIDYMEQLERVQYGHHIWCWDDSSKNTAQVGDLFGFYFHGIKVIIHQVLCIKPPSDRLPSWSGNVGQGDRNVLELSEPLLEISWEAWTNLRGYQNKMGTYRTKDLCKGSPTLHEFLKSIIA